METGLIFNSFLCIIIAIISFWIANLIKQKPNKTLTDILLLGFWLSVGFTWFLVSLGIVLFQLGFPQYDLILNLYGVQALIYIQLSFGVAYALYRAWSQRIFGLFVLIACLTLSSIGYYFLIQPEGFLFHDNTYFSVEYTINHISWTIFEYVLGFGLLFLIYDIFKNLFIKIQGKKDCCPYFLTSLSLLLYAVVGYFDNQGLNATWVMVLFRSIIILSILLTYLAYTQEKQEKTIKQI